MAEAVAIPKTAKKPNIKAAIERGEGILRLAPCWVPRSFLMPGRRLKLHPAIREILQGGKTDPQQD